MAVEPKAGQRVVSLTAHRGKADFVAFVQTLLTDTYAAARKVHHVLDKQNILFRKRFDAAHVMAQQQSVELVRCSRRCSPWL